MPLLQLDAKSKKVKKSKKRTKKAKQNVLVLGCNQRPVKPTKAYNVVNVDICDYGMPEKITVHDLEEVPWPFEDNTFDQVVAYDILEHIHTSKFVDGKVQYPCIEMINEIWRVLKLGGECEVMVPSTDGRGAAQDPTHVSFWNENSFLYYAIVPKDPTDPESPPVSHPWRKIYPHMIKAAFEVYTETQMADLNIVYVAAKLIKVLPPEDAKSD